MHRHPPMGQHFLKELSIAKEIAELGSQGGRETVLEIGPGEGVLTHELLEKSRRVIAVEKDKALGEKLGERFYLEIKNGRLELVIEDIRTFNPKDYSLKDGSYALVANIPYYLTGEILRTFIGGVCQPHRAVLLVQKEVAERIIAKDGKESVLSISIKAYGTPAYIKTVKKGSFKPPPRVSSAILLIENISREFFKAIPEEKFFKTLKKGFAHKRKRLAGNLGIDAAILEGVGLSKNIRAEDLSLHEWALLVSALNGA